MARYTAVSVALAALLTLAPAVRAADENPPLPHQQ